MFNLDDAVEGWRRDTASIPAIGGENRAELETHLRESVADLAGRGLTEEESFLVAIKRLGSAEDLSREFAKSDPARVWSHRMAWMLAGFLAFQLIGFASSFALNASSTILAASGLTGYMTGIIGNSMRLGVYVVSALLIVHTIRGNTKFVDRVANRVQSWSVRTLSAAGIVLITAITLQQLLFVPTLMFLARSFTVEDIGRQQLVTALSSSVIGIAVAAFALIAALRLRTRIAG